MPQTELIPVEKIRLDGGTQPRAAINPEACEEYASDMQSGDVFPAVEVYFDGRHYWLADGFHRVLAHRKARPDEPIRCLVYQGSLEDARWHSYGVNKAHGLRRTNEDKRRAVKLALTHPQGVKSSDRQIAAHVGVSHEMVRKHRKAMSDDCQALTVATRTGRDGRTINTANIGKRKARLHGKAKISPRAFMPRRGHSAPDPMIPLQFSPRNPRTAAATLVREFSRQWLEGFVAELTRLLDQQGEAMK